MHKKKIAKLRRELRQLRDAKYNLKRSDLTRFASKVGRKEDTSRGKEPTFVNVYFPEARPLSIPGHKDVKPHTANSILDFLETDLERLATWVNERESKENEPNKESSSTTICESPDSSGRK